MRATVLHASLSRFHAKMHSTADCQLSVTVCARERAVHGSRSRTFGCAPRVASAVRRAAAWPTRRGSCAMAGLAGSSVLGDRHMSIYEYERYPPHTFRTLRDDAHSIRSVGIAWIWMEYSEMHKKGEYRLQAPKRLCAVCAHMRYDMYVYMYICTHTYPSRLQPASSASTAV
jgi:hypothetical protein